MIRWSSPSLRPSEVILSILSTSGLTAPLCTLDARSERAFTMSCWICVGLVAMVWYATSGVGKWS